MRQAFLVGGVKMADPQEKLPGTPASRTWLVSHVPYVGLEPKPDKSGEMIEKLSMLMRSALLTTGPRGSQETFQTIRKTCPCNIYPIEPHFYIAKMGYAGVYPFFLFLLQNIDCGYSLERLGEAVLTCTHNLCFEQK